MREKLNSAFQFAGCRSSREEEWDHVFVRKIHTWVINASCASEAKHMRKQSCGCQAGKQDFPCRKAASSPGNGNSQDEVKSQHTRERERERQTHVGHYKWCQFYYWYSLFMTFFFFYILFYSAIWWMVSVLKGRGMLQIQVAMCATNPWNHKPILWNITRGPCLSSLV